MGNNDEEKPSKSDKSSSPAPREQANFNVYPDWAAMQAYYGPRVALPPYYNPAVASGHAPAQYMWGPTQPMMSPYGAPYAAIYPHGGVYAHPIVPHAATPPSVETHTKTLGSTDQGLMKKLKGFDGLAMSIGNSNAESSEGVAEHGLLHSATETNGYSEGSDGTTSGGDQTSKKRGREETPTIGGNGKTQTEAGKAASNKALGVTVATAGITGKMDGPVLSPGIATSLELTNPLSLNAGAPQPCAVLPPESYFQNDRELKREKRKQSNRESARRSRLRKQAESEELAIKVEGLTAENVALKAEMNRLTENLAKLKQENAALMEKLKNAPGQTKELILNKVKKENSLSQANNPSYDGDSDKHERNSKSGAKLHQLMDTNTRANAVAAG